MCSDLPLVLRMHPQQAHGVAGHERGNHIQWSPFLKAHSKPLCEQNFFNAEIWTPRGLRPIEWYS
jgi:hypothetical protein